MGVLKVVAVLLHAAGAAVMTYAWMELDNLPNNAWIVKQKGGHFQFLTIQGYVLQDLSPWSVDDDRAYTAVWSWLGLLWL